jgi:subtilisin family serine protease
MAAKTPRHKSKREDGEDAVSNGGNGSVSVEAERGEFTGRYIVAFEEGAEKEGMALLNRSAGIQEIARASDFEDSRVDAETIRDTGGVFFDEIGVAVVDAPPDAVTSLSAALESRSAILAMEPERILYALQAPYLTSGPSPVPAGGGAPDTLSYIRGYRDSVAHLFEQLSGGVPESAEAGVAAAFADTALLTWGLQATGVDRSRFSGRGIRVSILDTGIDLHHPDFAGRAITTQSFVPGQTVQDGHGHGTHCAGTACGTLRPSNGRRYGIAYDAQIFVGKVLSNGGSGPDGGILAGINWAVANRCHVVSMSLGAAAPPSPVYEQVGQRALAAGTLIVAAAGNESRRPGVISPVGRPANCASFMAVGAIDSRLQIAFFSNRGTPAGGGKVDIAGPGVDVYSSWPMPRRNNVISGTSMATPHVAGIAALWAEARRVKGASLGQLLTSMARPLTLSSLDVGAGLVQAP